jgi:hypothetical protein
MKDYQLNNIINRANDELGYLAAHSNRGAAKAKGKR